MHDTFDQLFIDYCSYFNGNEDYFECHEALEELWKQIAPRNKEHELVGLIQVATSLYHWRRHNMRGAHKSMKSAIVILQKHNISNFLCYFNYSKLLEDCQNALQQIEAHQPFQSFKLAINNPELLHLVAINIENIPTLEEHFITHKHALRDRSEVIAQRLAKLNEKGE